MNTIPDTYRSCAKCHWFVGKPFARRDGKCAVTGNGVDYHHCCRYFVDEKEWSERIADHGND